MRIFIYTKLHEQLDDFTKMLDSIKYEEDELYVTSENRRSFQLFNDMMRKVNNKYGVEDYCSILDKIEDELETYENSSSEKWQEAVENGNIPDSIQWFCGMIDTEYFLNECWI